VKIFPPRRSQHPDPHASVFEGLLDLAASVTNTNDSRDPRVASSSLRLFLRAAALLQRPRFGIATSMDPAPQIPVFRAAGRIRE